MRTKIWGQRGMALLPGLQCLCTPVPSPHPPREADRIPGSTPMLGPSCQALCSSCPSVSFPLHLGTFLLFKVFCKIFFSLFFFFF